MSSIKDQAGRIKRLKHDDTFKEVMQSIRDKQTNVFLDPNSPIGVIEDAHDIIRALNEIETYFNTVLADEAVFDKNQGKREEVSWKTRLRLG